jgi:hypothetical protein
MNRVRRIFGLHLHVRATGVVNARNNTHPCEARRLVLIQRLVNGFLAHDQEGTNRGSWRLQDCHPGSTWYVSSEDQPQGRRSGWIACLTSPPLPSTST